MRQEGFRLGKYWIGTVPGSPSFYRFWYDAGTGEVRRRTLKTPDLEDAKVALAAVVIAEGSGKPEQPESVMIATVMEQYYLHSDQTRSRTGVRQAGARLLDLLGSDATVGDFRIGKQRAYMRAMLDEGYAIQTVARLMSCIKAAFSHATKEDHEGNVLLLRAPQVIYSLKAVAAEMNVAEPEPRNWHPDLNMIAKFINGLLPEEEPIRRFAILKLAFASRSEATMEASPFALDHRYRLLRLNPEGRRQSKKHRPTLPVPANLWPVLTEDWTGETFVGRRYKLQHPWRAARERIGLPKEMIPHSFRHFMATELRHAHLRYDVERVPEDEREMWLGHRRASVHNSYGVFEPGYLGTAKRAVEAILDALNARLNQPIFRQNALKSVIRKERMTAVSRYTPKASKRRVDNA